MFFSIALMRGMLVREEEGEEEKAIHFDLKSSSTNQIVGSKKTPTKQRKSI